jgi:ABC-type branched-subunit amino acid transport system substrate-binding protein
VSDVLTGRDAGPEVATVVVLVPDSALGDSVLAAVNLALTDIDVGDWDVVVERVADGTGDGEDLATAGDVADEIASDRDVIAVIGGLTPEVIRAAQRPLDERSIPFVSPADDDPANTRGADPAAPQRPYGSYFRTAIPDGDPLEAAAAYAVSGLGAATVVAVHDGNPSQAAELARYATALGADARLSPVAELGVTMSGIESDELVALYLVGDGMISDVSSVTARSELQSVVIGGEQLASTAPAGAAGAFVAFVPATLKQPPNPSVPGLAGAAPDAAAAFDAGRAVAQMLERCLPPASGSARDARHGCLSEMDTVSVAGATGHVSFDQYGDRPGSWPTILLQTDDGWVDVAAR